VIAIAKENLSALQWPALPRHQPPPRLEAVAQHADEKEGNCNHATIML
jgi:hypothetical protein